MKLYRYPREPTAVDTARYGMRLGL